jgi:hypothetical protein
MSLHLRSMHQEEEKKFTCGENECSKVFSTCKGFKAHLNNVHMIEHKNTIFKLNLRGNVTEATNSTEEITDSGIESLQSEQSDVPADSVDPFDAILRFVLHLYSIPNMPRSTAGKIFNNVWMLILLYTNFIKILLDENGKNKIESALQTYEQWFKSLNTEHKLLKVLSEKGIFVAPKPVTIKKKLKQSHKNGVPVLKIIQTSAVMIPLTKLFKKILELPSTFNTIFANIEKLKQSKSFTNFIQSPLWKSKTLRMGNSLVLPYFLYFDDYVSDNALGSHNKTHSMANVYIKFPFLPIEIESKLDNNFLAYLFKTKDKSMGNKLMFSPLIDEMKDLEENGVDINIGGQIHNVKFIMALTIGDNLGLNEILGFVKCFRANHPCRLCKISKEELVKCFKEDPILFRNEANYTDDVQKKNVSLTGVHEECVFHDIKTFKVWENFSFDIMHDLLEGVFHYDLGHILHYFITKKCITLEILNDKKAGFDYGPMKIGNISELITKEHVKNKHFRFTSSEMLCFVQNLPFMIGEYIPEDDEVWIFFLDLLKILDIVMEPCVTESNLIYLDSLVFAHHSFYVNFFKDALKFKHHNMVHYSTVLRKIGPLIKIWCMRLEGMHKDLKNYSKNITCRKNLALSIAKKEQLKLSNRFFSNSIINWNETTLGSKVSDFEMENYSSFNLPSDTKYFKWIKFNGIKYEANLIIPTNEDDLMIPNISRIMCCFMTNEEVGLITKNDVSTMGYNEHFHCYIARTNKNNEMKVINLENSTYGPSYLHKIPESDDFGFVVRKF